VTAARGCLLTILATTLAACVLFTDVDGYSNGNASPDAAATTTDSAIDAGIDVVAPSVDASFDAPPDAPSFRDEFARADGPDLGNGWSEKSPDVFALAGGAVVKAASATHYRDNLVIRPVAEDRADVEVSAIFTMGTNNAYPQVFARAQRSTIGAVAAYDGYLLFLSGLAQAVVARQRGDIDEVQLSIVDLPETLSLGTRVKLTLRVYGESPPILEGLIDKFEGAGTKRIGETKISDGVADRVDTPGAVGFSASFDGLSAIDDFEWRALGTR
jgi:hypothetical protein